MKRFVGFGGAGGGGAALCGMLVALLGVSGGCNGTGGGDVPGNETDVVNGGDGDSSSPFVALAIGLNAVDPAHYGGWSGVLGGCEPDARDMERIASRAGLQTRTLLTRAATRAAVLEELAAEAARLAAGGLFVLSYSGHGGQVPDVNGDETDDAMDETWCLYDGELLDDELDQALSAFRPGVRVLVFSDSCHSGTVLRMLPGDFEPGAHERRTLLKNDWGTKGKPGPLTVRDRPALDPARIALRAMPPEVAIDTYLQHRAFYDGRGASVPRNVRANVQCQALLISGCEDDQLSADLGSNGLFTFELVRVWDDGAFSGGHRDFQRRIRAAVLASQPTQAPAFFSVGVPIPGFEGQKPYTTSAP